MCVDTNCGGCSDNNCPFRTSEVNLWDGTFTNIVVPSGAGLNEVLSLLENYILTIGSCNDVNYTLGSFSACLNLPAGTYSFTQIMDAIIARACANAGGIIALQNQVDGLLTLTTTNTLLTDIVFPSCFSGFTGTTSTSLFNAILSSLCTLMTDTAPILTPIGDDPISVTAPDIGALADPGGTNVNSFYSNARMEHIAETFKAIVDNHSFIYEHTSPVVSPTSFVVALSPMRGVVENFLVVREISENLTVNATMDTYFYLSADSTVLRREVAVAAPTPSTPAGSHSLYKVTSDGSGVSSVTVLYTSSALNPIPLGVDAVQTVNINNGAVTTAKIAAVTTAATIGDASLVRVRCNDEGQVLTLESNMLLSGLTNGQILVYNSGLNRFQNADNTAVNTIGYIPKVDAGGTNYDDSSIFESGTHLVAEKQVEINSGAVEADANAGLNIVGAPVLMPRMTAAAASLLPLTDGYLIYVTTINGTFLSVGFWGVENSVWVKL